MPSTSPSATVRVVISQYFTYEDKQLVPGQTAEVSADVAAAWRRAGYVPAEPAPPADPPAEPAPSSSRTRGDSKP